MTQYSHRGRVVHADTADSTFTCTADVVAELRRLHRPQMAAWVANLGEENTGAYSRINDLFQRLAECQRQLPGWEQPKQFDPTPPANASD